MNFHSILGQKTSFLRKNALFLKIFTKKFGSNNFLRTFAIPNETNIVSKRGSSSVGRAQPCQGWGREFEPRLPLQEQKVSRNADFRFEKYHPTGFNHMSVVLVHKVGFFVYTDNLSGHLYKEAPVSITAFSVSPSIINAATKGMVVSIAAMSNDIVIG